MTPKSFTQRTEYLGKRIIFYHEMIDIYREELNSVFNNNPSDIDLRKAYDRYIKSVVEETQNLEERSYTTP